MRLLVGLHQLGLGGSQLNALDLAREMAHRGHQVGLLGVHDGSEPGPLAQRGRELGLPVWTVRHRRERPRRGAPCRPAVSAALDRRGPGPPRRPAARLRVPADPGRLPRSAPPARHPAGHHRVRHGRAPLAAGRPSAGGRHAGAGRAGRRLPAGPLADRTARRHRRRRSRARRRRGLPRRVRHRRDRSGAGGGLPAGAGDEGGGDPPGDGGAAAARRRPAAVADRR